MTRCTAAWPSLGDQAVLLGVLLERVHGVVQVRDFAGRGRTRRVLGTTP
jgi:hypothetical protein